MRIAVIGSEGIVGGAVSLGMERLAYNVYRHDLVLDSSIRELVRFHPEIVYICVPTPQAQDGSCDTSIVRSVVGELASEKYAGIVAIKSTCEPGTTAALNKYYGSMDICFVPEFLREKSAFHDFTEGHDLLAIGTENIYVYDKIKCSHGHYPKTYARLSPTEAELLKYFSNVFNAMRVTFANGFYELCKKLGADYTKIKNAAVTRPTITDMYLDCNENLRGYGGPCLTKDSSAIMNLAGKLGIEANIFKTVVEDNYLYKTTVFEGMREE